MRRPDPSLLTPGVIDGYAISAFTGGACAALAAAIHQETGWPLVMITDAHNVVDHKAGGGSALHWAVQLRDGRLLDVDGPHDTDDLIERYDGEGDDDGAVDWGMTSMAAINEWYVEAQGKPVSIDLARTFVQPLLERHNLDQAPAPDDAVPRPGR